MKISTQKALGFSIVTGLFLIAVFGPASARPQAPAGPLPQTAPQDRTSVPQAAAAKPDVPRTKILAGTWRLNLDESDDPAKKLQPARGSDNGGQYGGRRGGGMGGGGPAVVASVDVAAWGRRAWPEWWW